MSARGFVVDAALAGQIGWRDEVRQHLRSVEQDARRLKDEIEAVLVTGGADDPLLRAASDEIARLFDDAADSPLLRALARRPADLEPGRPGRRSLDTRWRAIRGRAQAALDRYEAAAALRKGLARLHARFGERLPWHLARALERAATSADDAGRKDVAGIKARVKRLSGIELDLETLSAEVPLRADPPQEVSEWPAGVSPEELAWAVEASDRAEGAGAVAWRARGRGMAATHRDRLAGSTAAPRTGGDAIEAAAREVVLLAAAGRSGSAEDVDAWGVVLRAAARDRNPDGPVRRGGDAPPAETGSLLFVLPLFGPYVLVRTGRAWPARVEERGVRCGSPARVIAAPPPGADSVAVPAEAWAGPLFTLPADPGSAWLTTAEPAEIVPFARIGSDRWLAAVGRTGTLASTGEAAWKPAPRASRPVLRLLSTGGSAGGRRYSAGPALRSEPGAFGWRTDVVPVAPADVPEAWLRSAAEGAGRDHVEAEAAFFRSAALRVPRRTPRSLGRDAAGGGYLYAPPLAFRTGDSAPLQAWEREDPAAFVTAAARLWLALRDAGLALGFYHPASLGFRVLFGARDAAEPLLEAMALAAPLGTRMGAAYRRSRESLTLFPPYERLGRRLAPAQLEGDVALPETEAQALALYALDRLLSVPVELAPGAPWDELVDMASGWRFSAPWTAHGLVTALARGSAARAFEALATGQPIPDM